MILSTHIVLLPLLSLSAATKLISLDERDRRGFKESDMRRMKETEGGIRERRVETEWHKWTHNWWTSFGCHWQSELHLSGNAKWPKSIWTTAVNHGQKGCPAMSCKRPEALPFYPVQWSRIYLLPFECFQFGFKSNKVLLGYPFC